MGFRSERNAYRVGRELGLTPSARSVLLALAHCRNERDGLCNPGQSTLVEMTGWSERTVRDALATLVDAGVIIGTRRVAKEGRGSGPVGWVLNIDQPADAADDQPAALSDQPANGSDQPAALSEIEGAAPSIEVLNLNEPQSTVDVCAGDSFEEFWDAWPRKVAMPSARAEWARAVTRVDARVIVAAAIAYRDNPGRPESRFIPYPATWLERDGWGDDLPEPQLSAARQRQAGNLALFGRYRDADGPELAALPGLTSDYDAADSWMAFNR